MTTLSATVQGRSPSISPVELSLTQDKLVLTPEQESGNIWILDNVDH
jgi:hypothetical protein